MHKKTMNPNFFFLAPRLPHVVQGADDTGDSGCEGRDGRVGEESNGEAQLVPWCSFRQTVHQDADNIAVAVKHFVLVLKDVDAETFYARASNNTCP